MVNGACGWFHVMLRSKLIGLVSQSAPQTLGLRAGIVGVNFAVMLGLAGLLGFETFGRLAGLWAAALVTGTVLSLGGPLILLRLLTDGQGMRASDICKVAAIYPSLLSIIIFASATVLWSDWPWGAIVMAGFFANLLGCVASVMRALGSVQASMALRDAGPQVALGCAGLLASGAGAPTILTLSAGTMAFLALGSILWVWHHRELQQIFARAARPFWSGSLWASSVLGMIVTQIDLIVGGAVISAEQLGLYAVLRRVANLVALPVTVATWVSAPAISAAYGAGDTAGLAAASATGSRIAMLPGLALFAVGTVVIPLLPLLLPVQIGQGLHVILAILLLGALGQVFFASSFSLATLCGLAGLAMVARLLMVLLYLLWFHWWGDALTATSNAVGYVAALTVGGGALWAMVRRQLGVDTSAMVLLRKRRWVWKTS